MPCAEKKAAFTIRLSILAALGLAAAISACRGETAAAPLESRSLRLATTTSTYDSGLLDAILPDFESRFDAGVDVIAVGTGQALAIAGAGDADVVLVHAPDLERAFVESGMGTERYPVMYNDFVIVGPQDDSAGVRQAATGAEALAMIFQMGAPFASRGDHSGTWIREMELWAGSGLAPEVDMEWYSSLGQGMGETLQYAEQKGAYALTDRGTFLALALRLPHLVILFGGSSPAENLDPAMLNYYSVIPVNPERFPGVDNELSLRFVGWIRSGEVQGLIAEFGMETYGIPLFFPNAGASQR